MGCPGTVPPGKSQSLSGWPAPLTLRRRSASRPMSPGSERNGHGYKVVADAQGEPFVHSLEIGFSEAVDPAHRQGVEQNEATGHTADQIDVLFKKEVAEQVEPFAFGYFGSQAQRRDRAAGRSVGRRWVRTAQLKKERECRRVVGPVANQVSMSPWVQVTRCALACAPSQAKRRTAMLLCARTTGPRLSVSSPASTNGEPAVGVDASASRR